jgi:O-antigen ligase
LQRAVPELVALALQTGLTVPIGGQDLRLSAADIVLPVIATALLLRHILAKGPVRGLYSLSPDPRVIAWAFATTAWLTFALVNGHDPGAPWNAWALQNKYVGWFALLFFLFAGIVLARDDDRFVTRLFSAYVSVGWAMALATVVCFVLTNWFVIPRVAFFGPDARAIGLLSNANTYGLAAATALVLQCAGRTPSAPNWLLLAGLSLLIAAVALSGSRSAWLASVVGLGVLVPLRLFPWRRMTVGALCAAAIVAALSTITPMRHTSDLAKNPKIYISSEQLFDAGQHSANARVDQTVRALDLWRESPVFGVGLGRFLAHEEASGKASPEQIHSTYLWLLVETGVPGFVLMAGLFIGLVWCLRRQILSGRTDAVAGFASLAAFAAFIVFQEGLYQRHVWVFAGALLVYVSQPGSFADGLRRSGVESGTGRRP